MYSTSRWSSAQWPWNPPSFVHSVSRKSRQGSLMWSNGNFREASACRAVAVDKRSGIGAFGIATNPPSGRACASSHGPNSLGGGSLNCRSNATAAAVAVVDPRGRSGTFPQAPSRDRIAPIQRSSPAESGIGARKSRHAPQARNHSYKVAGEKDSIRARIAARVSSGARSDQQRARQVRWTKSRASPSPNERR